MTDDAYAVENEQVARPVVKTQAHGPVSWGYGHPPAASDRETKEALKATVLTDLYRTSEIRQFLAELEE